MKKLEEYVKSIPDFPEKGIIFRDVTSVLQDADGLHLALDDGTTLPLGQATGAESWLGRRVAVGVRPEHLSPAGIGKAAFEAQVDLSLERAALHSGDARISIPLDLASRMVEDAEFFGASGPLVRELDKQHGTSLRMEKH